VITSTHTADLPIPGIPQGANRVHVFPELQTNLIGITSLTQAGCQVPFQEDTCTISCPDCQGIQCHASPQGLWALTSKQIHGPTTNKTRGASPSLGNSCTPADVVAFHHATMFLPTISTLATSLKRRYIPLLPGLTETLLCKYQSDLEATTMGHLDNKCKNVQSTKPKRVQFHNNEDTSAYPEPDHNQSHACFLIVMEPQNIVYTDQTGRQPHPSSTGNNYILIAYDYDSNAILLRPYKNKTAPVLT
jgi:hypothetical protein